MAEPKKAWLLVEGGYSDYSVTAVYDDKALADRVLERIKRTPAYTAGYDARLEETTLNAGEEELRTRSDQSFWMVVMVENGNVIQITDEGWPLNRENSFAFYRRGNFGEHYMALVGYVWARDKTHAIKIVNEYRVAKLTLNEWPQLPKKEGGKYLGLPWKEDE